MITQGPQSAICCYPGCQKSVWQNPDGSHSFFCSKRHRDAMQQRPQNGVNANGAKLCKVRDFSSYSESSALTSLRANRTVSHDLRLLRVAAVGNFCSLNPSLC